MKLKQELQSLYLMMIDNMILREINELTTEYLEKKKELERLWASKDELNVLESEVKFKISVLLNGIPYHLMR